MNHQILKMINRNILQRTFLIGGEKETGTGFTIEKDEVQYLISAKHVFEELKHGEDTEITIFHDDQWKNLKVTAYIHDVEDIDVIVFSLESDLSPRNKIALGLGGVQFGQDTFFLGFPYGMFTKDSTSINNKSPFPFIKKATFSAFSNSIDEGTIGFLDGHTNPGFSGGPIVFIHNETKELAIGGIMRGYLKHEGEIEFEEITDEGTIEKYPLYYDENSGIIKINGIKHALEIIDKI